MVRMYVVHIYIRIESLIPVRCINCMYVCKYLALPCLSPDISRLLRCSFVRCFDLFPYLSLSLPPPPRIFKVYSFYGSSPYGENQMCNQNWRRKEWYGIMLSLCFDFWFLDTFLAWLLEYGCLAGYLVFVILYIHLEKSTFFFCSRHILDLESPKKET